MNAKWTSEHVPGQQGRLAVVTGANTALGFATAQVLAARGASLVLTAPDIEQSSRAPAPIAGTPPSANATRPPRAGALAARDRRVLLPAGDDPEGGDGRTAHAARRDRPRRARRPVLRPGRILRGQGLPETGPLQRAIPRHGHPAPPVDSLRTADRGHVPGLTRPRPKAGGIVMPHARLARRAVGSAKMIRLGPWPGPRPWAAPG